MVGVVVNYNIADNLDAAPQYTLSVTSNEPVSSDGDWQIVDVHHVQLRADRLGSGSGRVYTVTVTSTDQSGNSSSQAITISVPHNQGKKN